MARALYAQRTLLRSPQAARGKAPLAYALQAQREARPPGLDRPPAYGSARQAGRKAPTKESPTFEAVVDSDCTWHSHPRRECHVN